RCTGQPFAPIQPSRPARSRQASLRGDSLARISDHHWRAIVRIIRGALRDRAARNSRGHHADQGDSFRYFPAVGCTARQSCSLLIPKPSGLLKDAKWLRITPSTDRRHSVFAVRCAMVSLLPMFSQRTNWKLTPNRHAQALEELRAAGTPILDLTASNPTQCGFQYDTAAILDAFRKPEALTYDPQPQGLLPAREEVSRYYLEDHSAVVNPDSIVLTTSTSEAYSYVFRLLCNPHDEILVPKPGYPLFDFLADLQDVTLIPYALEYAHGWFIDFHSVIRALTPRTRAILLVHPN